MIKYVSVKGTQENIYLFIKMCVFVFKFKKERERNTHVREKHHSAASQQGIKHVPSPGIQPQFTG